MFELTGSRRDAASVIFNLPGYRVVEAVDLPSTRSPSEGFSRLILMTVARGVGGVVSGARLGRAAGA